MRANEKKKQEPEIERKSSIIYAHMDERRRTDKSCKKDYYPTMKGKATEILNNRTLGPCSHHINV